MTETYGDNLVIRTQSGESLAANPELKERLEAAAALPVTKRPDGLELPTRYRETAERLIDSPDLNHEPGELYLDLSPISAAC
ncbi:MAG TPA: hypothetical protein VKB23_09925 [Solirubrobacterales bacterium]|nr:hypothetical protein [Solirubrobacterales bacterium]